MNDQFGQLVEYVRHHKGQGISDEVLRQKLVEHKWDPTLIDKAFAEAKAAAPQPLTQYQDTNTHANNNPAEQKYLLFRGVADSLNAIKNNAAAFILGLIVSFVVAAGSLFALLFAFGAMLVGVLQSGEGLFALIVAAFVVYTLWFSFMSAFFMSLTSLAIKDGSENRKSAIGELFSASMKHIVRVTLANALVTTVAVWPVVIIALLPLIALAMGISMGLSSVVIIPLLMIVAVAWAIVALLRFALVSHVALFESELPLLKTLGRSKHLLTKGGQWFIVKGVALMLVPVLGVAVVTGSSFEDLQSSNNLAINILFGAIAVVANGVMVMLYHNRKAVKG